MKFIFPQNYSFTHKFLGFIDYSTLILNILWCLFLYFIINFLPFLITIKIFIFIILFFPVFLFSLIGFNHEKIIYIIKYILLFIFSKKLYLFKKF